MTHGILLAANNGGERRENDFYPTPPQPTEALIRYLDGWPSKIWEPACGDGGIGIVLEKAGFNVIGTDIVDRGYGHGKVDFLTTERRAADAIVTNPPFGTLAQAFIEHALRLGTPYIAMLLNINFWSAAKRTKLWEYRRPAWFLPLNWRPDFTGSGSPYFNCAWTVWAPESAPFTRFERLPEPKLAPATRDLFWSARQ